MNSIYDSGVIRNKLQGPDFRVLFVCSAGILRSATAASLYSNRFNTRCCGTAEYALIPLSINLLGWADEIVFMNEENYEDAKNFFPKEMDRYQEKVKVLDIPDQYVYKDPTLIKLIEEQYENI